jgi:signal transduction histidine kinase/FixJ family two-component response regulator
MLIKEKRVRDQEDKTCVLIIDDEKGIRDASERILTRMGCLAIKASQGEEGLDILNKERVSIVLLDMKMPGMDGLEVLHRIKEMDEDIVVIVITGFATVETAINAMKQGAYDFIPKPFEPDQLRIVVNRALEKIRLSKEAEALTIERQRTLSDLHMEQSRTRTIINALPNGVLVTNAEGQVVLVNPAFFKHMGTLDKEPGEKIESYVKDQGLCKLVMEISQGRHLDPDKSPTYEFNAKADTYLLARGRPVLNEKNECLGAVVNLVDISAIKILDRLKSEFVAKVSHELRSPLSTIHEQLALVLEDMVQRQSSEDKYLLSRAKEKTQGLISLIGDLLDLSRIESGSSFGETESVCIKNLLKGIVEFLKLKAEGKNQTLILSVCEEDHLPKIMADRSALESVFGNLIVNAINYTQEGGTITVSAGCSEETIHVIVEDNGFGIEEKHLKHIFEKFYRVKNAKTRFITGTGLGLSIVKSIVEELKGSIKVKSEPGVGTTFSVFLPVEKKQ